ncbi:uncharacterized protein I206_102916 [Kwoniella pini CBS 10737]|uniref:Cyanovirin-N domain-containing protein n=1 Tax=Kwoniella pini CBS 10737 TaxID=1296096 RepID=A0A1B9I6Z0_9TREE|nr:uncharacterized protein I206_03267 [Kwoniella pini CBS 10737]OCF51201.1 hypothetical protein I206_03267 [Kwoniella pini CBS 10737]
MFTLTSTVILFSILSSFVRAAPLPMPAVKQSEQLASRFYNHPDSNAHHTPCWQNGLQGTLKDDICVLAALNVDNNRHVPSHRSIHAQGQPCNLNGQPGIWRDATCVLANLDLSLNKKDFIPFQGGQECWINDRRGYYDQNGLCDLVDLNLIADVDNGHTFFDNGLPNGVPIRSEAPCWVNGQPGFWQNDFCVLSELNVSKRNSHGTGIVGDVLDTLTGYEDCYNCGPGPTRHAVLPTDDIVDGEALVDVDHINQAQYKRNGLLHNAPDGNEVDGGVRTLTQLLDHSINKRDLSVNELPIIDESEGTSKYNYNPNGSIQSESTSGVIADLEAQLNVDEGDEPYYGPNSLYKNKNNILNLKRDLLNNGNLLSSFKANQNYPEFIRKPNGEIIPIGQTSNIIAEVKAAVNLNNDNEYITSGPYSHNGLLGRDLGGLSGVNGLGLNKDGKFPQGSDVVPQLGDLLGAGKGKDILGGLGEGTNGLNRVL